MAIISVVVTDAAPVPTRWAMPTSGQTNRSPVPQGLLTYSGKDAIATLAGGNQTSYSLAIQFPAGFAYLPRTILMRYSSDDLDISWDADGFLFADRPSVGASFAGSVAQTAFSCNSNGIWNRAAAFASRVWAPTAGSPKLIFQTGDELQVVLADIDVAADGATAGDMTYWIQLYVFNIDQIDNWEVNTPIPVISHTSF